MSTRFSINCRWIPGWAEPAFWHDLPVGASNAFATLPIIDGNAADSRAIFLRCSSTRFSVCSGRSASDRWLQTAAGCATRKMMPTGRNAVGALAHMRPTTARARTPHCKRSRVATNSRWRALPHRHRHVVGVIILECPSGKREDCPRRLGSGVTERGA